MSKTFGTSPKTLEQVKKTVKLQYFGFTYLSINVEMLNKSVLDLAA